MNELENNVKQLMKIQGLNNVELAKKIGVSKQYISQILSGKQDVRVSTLTKLANALDVSIARLLNSETNLVVQSSKAITKKVIFQIEVDESVDDNCLKMVIGKNFFNQI